MTEIKKLDITLNVDIKKLYKLYNKLYKKYSSINYNKIKDEVDIAQNMKDEDDYKINFIKKSLLNYNIFIKKELSKIKIPLYKNKNCFSTYKVIKSIGKGYFGEAFLAERDNKQYAIKLIRIEKYFFYTSKYYNFDAIHNEMNAMKKLGPLGISPHLYDYYICKNENNEYILYMIMEYMNMGSLDNYISQGNKLTNGLKKQLKEKIHTMHSHGIFHIDLHNGNILLHKKADNKIEPFIGDFGISIKRKAYENMNTLHNLNINKHENKKLLYNLIFSKMLKDYIHFDL